jgi:hypothetical protein
LVYARILIIFHPFVVDVYATDVTREVKISNLAAEAISVKDLNTAPRWEMSLMTREDAMAPCGKVERSKRVTMPKLLPPPFRARKRSG